MTEYMYMICTDVLVLDYSCLLYNTCGQECLLGTSMCVCKHRKACSVSTVLAHLIHLCRWSLSHILIMYHTKHHSYQCNCIRVLLLLRLFVNYVSNIKS